MARVDDLEGARSTREKGKGGKEERRAGEERRTIEEKWVSIRRGSFA